MAAQVRRFLRRSPVPRQGSSRASPASAAAFSLAPLVVFLGWCSPRQAAGLSAPFIFMNSILALGGALATGQRPAQEFPIYAVATLTGAVIGTAIGLRWMSQAATRLVLASILLVAGVRLLLG
ncbi:MAG: hypothetical protein WDN69_00330 [Aliidongia sp.]